MSVCTYLSVCSIYGHRTKKVEGGVGNRREWRWQRLCSSFKLLVGVADVVVTGRVVYTNYATSVDIFEEKCQNEHEILANVQ